MTTPRELEPPVPRSRPQLTWNDSAGSHALELGEIRTAGSAVHCELVIADKTISRIHFELDPQPDGLWVRDLGSRNGTYVNGVKITEARVPAGTVIRIGTTDMTVAYGNPEPLRATTSDLTSFGDVEGYSAAMREVFATLSTLAKTESSIIIEGEPGTGKKALARAVHDASSRAGSPFVVIECAALPKDEAAIADTFEEALGSAEGGTLVLDAPGELPLAVQRELTPPLDAKAFRVIVTTQRDLRRLVNQGAFRESLYFRVAGATVRVPPLRQRTADLVPLLERFLGDQVGLATPQLLADLQRLPWMGNVRELRLYAERLRAGDLVRAVATARLDAADSDDFRRERMTEGELATLEAPAIHSMLGADPPAAELGRMLPIALEPWFLIGFKEFRERWIDLGEREYLRRLMLRTNRSSSVASREAGLERTYLYRLIKKHGV